MECIKRKILNSKPVFVLKENRFPLIAGFITFFLLILVSIIREIAPFGENSLLTMDLWGQYYPMITEKLSSPFSTWSWNGSLGFSSLVQGAYYTNSLFNFLLLPFFGYARIAALDMVIFLKLALSAWSFAYYLERRSETRSPISAALGVAYALSAYSVAFVSQPMWLDILFFLPLLILGMERMMAGKNPWMYVTFLALTIYSNFYIGWAICIFSVIWFFVTIASDGINRSFSRICRDSGKFAFFSLISGALCAFVLLPVLYGMKNWISSSLGFDKEIAFYHKLPQIVDQFSYGVKPSLEYGVANIFCGSASLFFAFLLLTNRKISLRKKIAYTAVEAFMLLSFELNLLDYIWHGLHFPNQLPGRQSFLWVFVVLLAAYEVLTNLDGCSLVGTASAFVVPGFLLLFVGYKESGFQTGRLVAGSVLILTFALVSGYLFVSRSQTGKRWLIAALSLLIMADAGSSAVVSMAKYLRCTDAVSYAVRDHDMRDLTAKYESGKDSFWRSELIPNFTFNSGMIYGFKGVTYYSSTMNGNLYRFFESLGNRVYAQNVSSVYIATPIQDMMFGIRYHYLTGGSFTGYGELLEKQGGIVVEENRYALPVAYAVNSDIQNFTTSGKTPLEAQNHFARLATGIRDRDTVVELKGTVITQENAYTYESGGRRYYSTNDPGSQSVFTLAFDVTETGIVCLDFDFTIGDYEIKVNDLQWGKGSCGREPIKNIGYLQAGDRVTVTVNTRGYRVALYGVNGYVLRDDMLERVHRKLSQNTLDVTYASQTKIRGNIQLKGDMVLYSSIPAENGWEIYIDGVRQETFALDGALLCCHIKAGEHTVEYRYQAPGLMLGVGISMAAVFLLAGYSVYQWLRRSRNARSQVITA